MSLINELKRRGVPRVAAAYAVTAWLIIQIAETLFPLFGFGDAPARTIVIVLGLGFIPAILLAWFFEITPEGVIAESELEAGTPRSTSAAQKWNKAIVALLVLAVGYFAFDKFYLDPRNDADATRAALDGIETARSLVGDARFSAAWLLARELDSSIKDGALKEQLWSAVSVTLDIESTPAGADVWMRPYRSSDEDWQYLGKTPLPAARLPIRASRMRLEMPGYRNIEFAPFHLGSGYSSYSRPFVLDREEDIPEGMVRVAGDDFSPLFPGMEHLKLEIGDFYIDKYEVSNREYQAFVDAGGYEDPQYWRESIVLDGEELPFEQAMDLFRDKTGRYGPATWEVGAYPDGQADFPVSGISWYEAAAYAVFVNKELPTVFHWRRAGENLTSEFLLPASNFSGKSAYPVNAGDGLGVYGTHNMAGNVREWAWNSDGEFRFVLGGAWSDPAYMFQDPNAQPPLSRDPATGFRLMRVIDDRNMEQARATVRVSQRDYRTEQPVSDDTFRVFKGFYAYDKATLNAELVLREEAQNWSRERIDFDAAYGSERASAFLYLPKGGEPPYQTVVLFPGSGALYVRDIGPPDRTYADFLLRSGRAVLLPVYKGTYHRPSELRTDVQDASMLYRDHVIQWSKDLSRAIDYLETRGDIDMSGLGYFGASWGGQVAPIMLANEPRLKAAALVSGGLTLQPVQPEADAFNFLSRVTVPVLMVNLPNDFFFPVNTSQQPFFDNLGSEHKNYVLVEGGHGHFPPRNRMIREVLDWFDKYL